MTKESWTLSLKQAGCVSEVLMVRSSIAQNNISEVNCLLVSSKGDLSSS